MGDSSGRLQYLTVVGYSDRDFGTKIGSYRALVNPDKYTENCEIHFDRRQSPGTPNTALKFLKATPKNLNIELLFDGTGILSPNRTDVPADIDSFKKIAYTYNGGIHKPNYLKVIWGKGIRFQCQLTTLTINYTMFRSDGTPLRARATVAFKEYQSPKEICAKTNNSSPDMTHECIVKAGDTLPALTNRIYGDSSHYLKVAAYNKLDSFRYLVPGTTLYFPPLV
jgi:nucleoid-associated protein YgaU